MFMDRSTQYCQQSTTVDSTSENSFLSTLSCTHRTTTLFQVLTFAYQTMMSHLHCFLVLKSFKVPSKLLLELSF